MKILLTGANGYIGKRLLPKLIEEGHYIVCSVRDKARFHFDENIRSKIEIIEMDTLIPETLRNIPKDIDAAYYLVHSMADSANFQDLELQSASNFRVALSSTQAKHLIYLSGIVNEAELSKHLLSRKNVEIELSKGSYHFTCIRAGIIVGSGSASFEIIRDLVEKLPIMITPRWLLTRCQPIAVSDVISALAKSLMNEKTFDRSFDIGADEITNYKEMLLSYARVRKLKRRIWIVPVMTPRLSSYWLYFVTSTSYKLAQALVDSMKVEVICRDNELLKILNIQPISYIDAIIRAFDKIESNEIISSWKDAYSSSDAKEKLSKYIFVPEFGCFKDQRKRKIENFSQCIDKLWSIGGDNGWYYANWLWRIRGFLDKLFGGVGLRRGRTNQKVISAGDALDFWRVIYAAKDEVRLLLYAEMKLPGEAWLEFKVAENILVQTATFRPLGLLGRLYWYLVFPLHSIIFKGLIRKLTENTKVENI
jgi:uncharacterized protein YbjT (DUF2867 family)